MNVVGPLINVVSDFGDVLSLQREEVDTACQYVFSKCPVEADYHVVVGQLSSQEIPRGSRAQIFVALEPPEIFRYDISVLAQYTATLGPGFRYLRKLPRHFVRTGLLPWRIGYESESPTPPVRFRLPEPIPADAPPIISALISAKSATPKQRSRSAAVEQFARELGNFSLAGRDRELVRDKADSHRLGRFHLAVENSRHPFYNTEKLYDGILMKNIVFYDGDRRFLRLMDPRAFIIVNVDKREATKRTLARFSSAGQSEEEQNALELNRALVLRKFNFFSNLEHVVFSLEDSGLRSRSSKSLVYPHQVVQKGGFSSRRAR